MRHCESSRLKAGRYSFKTTDYEKSDENCKSATPLFVSYRLHDFLRGYGTARNPDNQNDNR
jgi:hypothetical protein